MLAGDTRPLLNARPPDYAALSAVAGMVAAVVVVTIADGTYEVKDVVWPVFAHNPFVTRIPSTGEWVSEK